MFYVNLPLRYIAAQSPHFERFLKFHRERGHKENVARGEDAAGPEFGLELGLDAAAMENLPLSWHQELAARLTELGVGRSLHLPFQDLAPGSADPLIREASRERLAAAVAMAQVYAPAHMVGHPIYNADSWDHDVQRWAACSADSWTAIMNSWPEHPPLYLENIFEQEPEPLALLMETLRDRGRDPGICFDVGHWHSFSKGGKRRNLKQWIATLAPWIRHLHLHDNDGSSDAHKGLGQGGIDFPQFFALLQAHQVRPSVTFEPHDEESFLHTLDYLANNPELFRELA